MANKDHSVFVGLSLAIENKQFSILSTLQNLNGVQVVFTGLSFMADNSKRTPLQKVADLIRVWQLKYDNETVKNMLAHPVWKSTEKMIVAKPRENGRGDWVM